MDLWLVNVVMLAVRRYDIDGKLVDNANDIIVRLLYEYIGWARFRLLYEYIGYIVTGYQSVCIYTILRSFSGRNVVYVILVYSLNSVRIISSTKLRTKCRMNRKKRRRIRRQ